MTGLGLKQTHGPRRKFAIADLRRAGRELVRCGQTRHWRFLILWLLFQGSTCSRKHLGRKQTFAVVQLGSRKSWWCFELFYRYHPYAQWP